MLTHTLPRAARAPHRRLADQIGSRDNRIDQLRLFAALAVVLGHSWHIALGRDAHPPLQDWTIFGFHSLAVHVFFFLSGLLVTESARRHIGKPVSYVRKRALRIMPALIVNAIAVPIILVMVGAWTGVGIAEMGRYALKLITLMSVQYEDAGAFAGLPFDGAINGSVWSLRHEIIVYTLLIGASLVGALAQGWKRWAFLGFLLAYVIIGHAIAPYAKGGALYLFAEGRHVMFSFLLGVTAHQFADRVPLNPVIALPGVALLLLAQGFDSKMLAENGVIWLTCSVTLLLAYPRGSSLQLPHDVSYGVYIWSWPIQQLTVFFALNWFGIALSPMGLFALCIGPLLLVSLASWLWVEKPALRWAQKG